jgi:hypothetical protein
MATFGPFGDTFESVTGQQNADSRMVQGLGLVLFVEPPYFLVPTPLGGSGDVARRGLTTGHETSMKATL